MNICITNAASLCLVTTPANRAPLLEPRSVRVSKIEFTVINSAAVQKIVG